MRNAYIPGSASSVFGRFDRPLVTEAADVVRAAVADAGLEPADVDTLYVGNYAAEVTVRQAGTAALIAREAGTTQAVATRVEGICASGAIAFAHAVQAVRAGMSTVAVALGVEMLTSVSRDERTRVIAMGFDQEIEGREGWSFPAYFASVALEYAELHGLSDSDLYEVAEHNHARGRGNPVVSRPRELTREIYDASPLVHEPLRVLDCCGAVDGAAAVVVTASPPRREPAAARVLAVAQATGPGTARGNGHGRTSFPTVVRAARQAFAEAGVAPDAVDVAEVHDAFTISQLVDLEDIGLFERGRGRDFLDRQDVLYVNPSGGLLARGHPIGATGVAQICELVAQLRGTSHFQHPGPTFGLAQTLGGVDAHATVSILSAE